MLCGALRGTVWGLPRHTLISSRQCSGLAQVQNQASQVLHRALLGTTQCSEFQVLCKVFPGTAPDSPMCCMGLPKVAQGSSRHCLWLSQVFCGALPGVSQCAPRCHLRLWQVLHGVSQCVMKNSSRRCCRLTHTSYGLLPGAEPGSPKCLMEL